MSGRPRECLSYWNLLIATAPGHLYAGLAEGFGPVVQLMPEEGMTSIISDILMQPDRLYYRG